MPAIRGTRQEMQATARRSPAAAAFTSNAATNLASTFRRQPQQRCKATTAEAQASAQGQQPAQPLPAQSKAVVIGAGMAGLAAAKALSDYFDEVTVLERDGEVSWRCA
jgi:heterodisulfide reductase subunit A-like polyferredoxin